MIRNPFSKRRDSEAVASVASLLSSGSGISNPFEFKIKGFDFSSFDDLGESRRQSLEAVLRVVAFFSGLTEWLGNRACFHKYFFQIRNFLLSNGWSSSEENRIRFLTRSQRLRELAETAVLDSSHELSILKSLLKKYEEYFGILPSESDVKFEDSNCTCTEILFCPHLGNSFLYICVQDMDDRVRTIKLNLFVDRSLSDHAWSFVRSECLSRNARRKSKIGVYEGSNASFLRLWNGTEGRDGWFVDLEALNLGEREDDFCMKHHIDVASVQLELNYEDRLL